MANRECRGLHESIQPLSARQAGTFMNLLCFCVLRTLNG